MQDQNKKRANRALNMISASGYADESDLDSRIADALTDLQHLATNHGYHFDSLMSVAQSNFESEFREDSLLTTTNDVDPGDAESPPPTRS